jgi:hypothetical protein
MVKKNRTHFQGGVMIMPANATIIRDHGVPTLSHAWDMIRKWFRKLATAEKKADAVLAVGTLALIGYVLFVMNQAFRNATIIGGKTF